MEKNTIKLGNTIVGRDQPMYFIADIAANHDGDIGRAYRLIELAKEAGADAAKFQNFVAARIVSKKGFEGLGRKLSHQSKWKKPVYQVYEDASLSYDWTQRLKSKCDEVGIEYFTSPYDMETVDRVDPYVSMYKIGSGDITWLEIVEYIAKKGKPVLIATGASNAEDVHRAMAVLLAHTKDIVLMQCNTNYTVDRENYKYVNLNVLKTFARTYPQVVLGLSDHTIGDAAVLGAIALGARVIEKHFTDDNTREGPDHAFAMNPHSWRDMVERAHELYDALGDGVKRVEKNEEEAAIVQRRALRYTRDMKSGETLAQRDLVPVRPIPQGGIPPYEVARVLGRGVGRDVQMDDLVVWSDLCHDQA